MAMQALKRKRSQVEDMCWLGEKRRTFDLLVTILLVPVLYLVATLVVTYPLPLQLFTHTARGKWAYDALQYIWTIWWTDKALFDLHVSPANLSLIQFPSGVYHPFLLAVDYVGFAGIPFARLTCPLVAHNLLMLLSFVLNGFTTYLFCLELTKSRLSSFIAGMVFAFFPRRMEQALEGQLDLISTYWFPLYGLFLNRLLRRPSMRLAVLCGISLGLSMWVEVMYVPYFLIPFTLAVLACSAWVERRPLGPALPALGVMLGAAGLIAAPFLMPFLLETIKGELGYLQERGTVAFSVDLLGFIAPSPDNPVLQSLRLVPPFARRVVSEFYSSETLAYLGFIPMALSVWAIIRQPGRTVVWAILSIGAALLSMGPFLRVSGQVVTLEVDGFRSYIPMPYSLLAQLPGMALGRTPGRLTVTLGFGLAVLVAYGWADVFSARHLSLRLRVGLTTVFSLLIMLEYLVRWPIPTFPLPASDAPSQTSKASKAGAVLNIPTSSYEVELFALYYQTIHEHAIFGGRVFRNLPGSPELALFLEDLNQKPPEEDVIPRALPEEIAVVDRASDVSYVYLFEDYVADAEQDRAFLTNALGQPVWTEQGLAVFRVPQGPGQVNAPVYGLDRNWHGVEAWDGVPSRWMPYQANLYIYSPSERGGALHFRALPLSTPSRLQIEVNDVTLPPLVIGDWITYTTSSFTLRPGFNTITFRAEDGCISFVGDPRCTGLARAAGADCSPYLKVDRCLSILFQNIRFVEHLTGPAEYSLDVALGGYVRFLGYDLESYPVAGEEVSLILYWQTLNAIEHDYTIFVHLLGPDGQLLAQCDGPPLDGIYPTSKWVVDDVLIHRVTLKVPSDAQPGKYDLLVGMYTYPDLSRLPVLLNGDSDRPHAEDGVIWLQSVDIGP